MNDTSLSSHGISFFCFLLEDHPPQGREDGHTVAAGHVVLLVLQVNGKLQPLQASAVPTGSLQVLLPEDLAVVLAPSISV